MIEHATCAEDLFDPKGDLKAQYRKLARRVHPDGGGTPVLFAKLTRLYEEAQLKKEQDAWGVPSFARHSYVCAGAKVYSRAPQLYFDYESGLVSNAIRCWAEIAKHDHFKKYLPSACASSRVLTSEGIRPVLAATLPEGARRVASNRVQATHAAMDPKHVGWIGSRLLELVAFFHKSGFVCAGVTPDTVFIVPETHGIVLVPLVHMAPTGSRLKTIAGSWLPFYPSTIRKDPQARPELDVNMVLRLLVWLLGDKSGHGALLYSRGVDARLVRFLLRTPGPAFETYQAWRDLLHTLYGSPKFHKMTL